MERDALRAYFVDELTAASVVERFGYSPRVVHPMASELRAGKAAFLHASKPGLAGPRKSSGSATGCSRCAPRIVRSPTSLDTRRRRHDRFGADGVEPLRCGGVERLGC